MSSSAIDLSDLDVRATAAKIAKGLLAVDLEDGRRVCVPIEWYPRLMHGTPKERGNVRISEFGLHWPDLDEDLSVKGLLLGHRSGESRKSLNRWLSYRAKGQKAPVKTVPLPSWAKA